MDNVYYYVYNIKTDEVDIFGTQYAVAKFINNNDYAGTISNAIEQKGIYNNYIIRKFTNRSKLQIIVFGKKLDLIINKLIPNFTHNIREKVWEKYKLNNNND